MIHKSFVLGRGKINGKDWKGIYKAMEIVSISVGSELHGHKHLSNFIDLYT